MHMKRGILFTLLVFRQFLCSSCYPLTLLLQYSRRSDVIIMEDGFFTVTLALDFEEETYLLDDEYGYAPQIASIGSGANSPSAL